MLRIAWNIARYSASLLAATYTVGLVLHAASLYVLATRPHWLELVDTFSLVLYLPLPLLLVVAPIARTRLAWLAVAIAGALFFGVYGYRFIPRPLAQPAVDDALTVLTHNVLASNPDTERVLRVIRDENPDIIALQELSDDMSADLTQALGTDYPYQVLAPGWTDGMGVFSRYRVLASRAIALTPDGHPVQTIDLDVRGQRITLLNVHLQSPDITWQSRRHVLTLPIHYDASERDRELAALTQVLDGLSPPVILVGDLNLPERSEGYLKLTMRLGDAFRDAGYGFGHTFPQSSDYTYPGRGQIARRLRSLGPVLRIDYILHSTELRAFAAHVAAPTGSDHRPVVARLAIEPLLHAQP